MSGSSDLFNRLADETILDIMSHLYLDSFEEFGKKPLNESIWHLTLCSKRLWRLGMEPLYSCIRVTKPCHVNGILSFLMKTPAYGNFVKKLEVECYYEDEDEVEDTNGQNTLYMDGDNPFIKDGESYTDVLLALVNVAKHHGLSKTFISAIQSGKNWARVLLLIHLLPSLEELIITPDDLPLYATCLSRLFHQGRVFSKLRSYTRRYYDTEGSFAAQTLIPIFLHPSVIEIQAHSAAMWDDGALDWQWLLPFGVQIEALYGNSNVETLELWRSRIDGDKFATLLRLPRALKRLVYVDEIAVSSDFCSKDSFEKALHLTSQTLEVLSVCWDADTAYIHELLVVKTG
ncbi:14916_t:CDS:1 [Acaulospora colombiana]|uniref:14916_t:CDS:1 n=1 Tax=Acaulospora colombiana TaxID=27376 RepID=A0ACA9N4K9_9GLOM|nr:14916_t:CDS:1 [Acaulospora colombiana]